MKKNLFMLASAVVMLVTFNSCGKDVLDLDKTLKFSTQSVEEQKASIEQSGIDFVDNMDDMMNSDAMGAVYSFISVSNADLSYVKPFIQLQKDMAKRSVKTLENFDKQLRVAADNFEGQWGTYTWDSSIEDFKFVEGQNGIAIFKFPATEGSNTNNGELKITYSESDVVAPDTDPEMYMPSSVTVTLKVDGSTAMKAEFSASYKSDATPTKAKQTLEIDEYKWTAEMTNNTDKFSAKYEFKKGSKTMVKMEAGVEGDLTADAIENSDGPQDVISNGAVYFQVMNIAFLGGISDMEGFANEMENISYSSEYDYYVKEAAIINKYLKMYGYFVDENRKFADVEFYVASYDDGYYTYYELQPRFVLSDGSKVDIENYIETGFEDLFEKLEDYGV